jgi:hypothetical protein
MPPKRTPRHGRPAPKKRDRQQPLRSASAEMPVAEENMSDQAQDAEVSTNWEVDFSSQQFRPRWWRSGNEMVT